MAETKTFKVNAPVAPATAWRFQGNTVLAGQEIEVPVEKVERLTKIGMIGEPVVVKKESVPVRKTQEIQRPLAIPSQEGNTVDPIVPKTATAPEPAGEVAPRNRGGRPRKTEVDAPVESDE